MLKCLPLLLFSSLMISFSTVRAFTGSISGIVTDEGGKPLVFASIMLQQAGDSSMVKTELTDERGQYNLSAVANGQYYLKIMLIGYESAYSGKLILNNNSISMPGISLKQSETKLEEVTVSAQKPFIEVHPDMLVVNVENSIVSTGSSVLDVLQRSPGVTVDQNDNISLKGKQGVNIMIDGRIVPVSSADLANMLKSMPANTVDKIELISNPSAKYDAAGTAGIINIKTKKDNKMGLNGSANGGYGQGIYPKENAGFSLNYRKNKLNVYASYNANYRTGFSHVDWDRKFYSGSLYTGAYVQDNYSVLSFHTNIASAGADYNLSSKTSVGISVSGENYHLGTKGYYAAKVYGPADEIDSFFATNNTSAGNWNNYAPNIHLKHTFDSSGKEFTIDGDYARYWNVNTQDFTTNYSLPGGAESKPPYILHADIAGLTQIRSVKADYTNPLKNDARFEAGIKTSFVTADNEPKFYDRSNGGNIFDSTKSDHFIYTENINAAYINANKAWTKWSTQLGLRAEQTIVSGVEKVNGQAFGKNYLQLFPSLAVQDHLNASNDLGITLSRRIERPGYSDLNPYKFFVDPSTYKTGNQYLVPALTYAVEMSHTYKQRFITTLSYSVTSNVITEVIKPDTAGDRVTIQTKDNLTAMRYFGISGSYTIPLFKWWTNVTNYDAYYAIYEGNLSNTDLKVGKPTFDVYTSNKFTLPKDWSAELTVFYQAAQVYGFLNLTPISMFNLGIQKNMFDKRLTIRASANDIFWHGSESGSSYFTNYTEFFTAVHDTRQVSVAVTYRFGKKTVAPLRKHSGGAEEEKKRANEQGA
jgi:outer membrane beta-barrel protein/carboxypeptidase family protein/TonB-dependent receptor-like protein